MNLETVSRDVSGRAGHSPSEPLLDVRGLVVRSADGLKIVDGLDLSIAAGEAVAIVGESGSGKSMTARALTNLLPHGFTTEGRVALGSTDVLAQSRRAMRRIWGSEISMVMQDPFTSLNPIMKVWVQITESLRRCEGKRTTRSALRLKAAHLLAEVGITDAAVLDNYPFELSGGMRQRVAIAAAIAAAPRVLIADEPTTALDTTTQQEVLALLRGLQRQRNMGMLLITHDLRLAFSTCDRVFVLYAGVLLEVAQSARMWNEPLHPYTLGLLLSEPPVDRKVERLVAVPGSVPQAGSAPAECVFAPRCRWDADECRSERPALVEINPGRLTACRRVRQIGPEMHALRAESVAGVDEMEANGALRSGVLEVRELTKQYHGSARVALDGASLVVASGECVGLVGESGSGKTTLARCVLGLETPTSGTVSIDGTDASDYRRLSTDQVRRIRSQVQIVFQDPYSSLNPMRSIGHTLRQAASLRAQPGGDDAYAEELMDMVGLPRSYLKRRPGSLSGGERQRVAIARALAVRPSLLVCDEVVSALDVSVQAQILNLLADLRRDLGLSVLFVSHDLAVVRQVTERVYVLYRGKVVESGRTADVLSRPMHAYTQRLVAAAPRVAVDSDGSEPRP